MLAVLPLLIALALFLALGAYQLHLPGLHYDEAKEAGLNAMQLLLGQPVTAFRDATVAIGPWRVPLMVQDYIGALNVVLAAPFLAVGGVNVVALRWLPLVIAALTLVMVWLGARRLGGPVAAAAAALLLAVNPSFVFWSRQGIFVTNLTALLFLASLWTGVRWWQERRPRDLWLTAFLWGLGIYAKLLFVWAIGALVIVAAGVWVLEARSWKLAVGGWKPRAETRLRRPPSTAVSASTLAFALACFLFPLTPLILFNVRTGGTLASIFGNLGSSYYGVDNSAYLANLATRVGQIGTLLRGDHFWYLGEAYANPWALWLAAALILLGLAGWIRNRITLRPGLEALAGFIDLQARPAKASNPDNHSRKHGSRYALPAFLLPLTLLALMVAQSAFTVSDLFITHYAILLPLIPLAAGLAVGMVWRFWGVGVRGYGSVGVTGYGGTGATKYGSAAQEVSGPVGHPAPPHPHTPIPLRATLATLALLAVLAWAGTDAWTTLRYHRILSISGGYGAHSDASARLAAYLDEKRYTAPVVLDWGMDAPLRFLTGGRVAPVEVFGYERLDAPDPGFAERVSGWLADNNTVYVGPPAEKGVFRGRVEAMAALAEQQGRLWLQEAWFHQRSGEVLFVIYRSIPKG